MKISPRRALLVPILAAFVAGIALPAAAQQPDQQPLPSYARPSYAQTEQTIRGRVTTVNGMYMEIADVNGYTDRVQLHQGTIINPTGIRLAPGMTVTIMGHANGSVFVANEIDTPYDQYGGPPGYVYGYPYPYYYPYPYPWYGPTFGIGIGFGYRGWWR